jgi:nitrate reductase gamma subunit
MNYFIYASCIALFFCIVMCFIYFFRLIKLGPPKDLSEKSGSVTAGVVYSNTKAMMPQHKESAYKHLPTYTAGILFHLGSFLALFLFVLLSFDLFISDVISIFFFKNRIISSLIAIFLWFTTCCGIGLIIKRIVYKKLRPITNADDYLATGLVTLFHLTSAILFIFYAFHCGLHQYFSNQVHESVFCAYFLSAILLFLYLPFGKLKHSVYFFAARYHLGFFYGRRGTWPPSVKK